MLLAVLLTFCWLLLLCGVAAAIGYRCPLPRGLCPRNSTCRSSLLIPSHAPVCVCPVRARTQALRAHKVVHVGCGANHTMAVTADAMFTWGSNMKGARSHSVCIPDLQLSSLLGTALPCARRGAACLSPLSHLVAFFSACHAADSIAAPDSRRCPCSVIWSDLCPAPVRRAMRPGRHGGAQDAHRGAAHVGTRDRPREQDLHFPFGLCASVVVRASPLTCFSRDGVSLPRSSCVLPGCFVGCACSLPARAALMDIATRCVIAL